MKVSLLAAALLAAGSMAGVAHAETDASLGYSSFKFKKAQYDAITGRLSWNSGWFGVEGQLSAGVADSNRTVSNVNINTQMRHEASIYATGTWPVGEDMNLFGRVGFGTTNIKSKPNAATGLSGTDESWNLGFGGNWYFYNKTTGLRAEYTREFFSDFSSDADVWSLSAVHKF